MEEAEASTKRMDDMAQALQAEVSSVQQIDENIAHVAGIVDNNSEMCIRDRYLEMQRALRLILHRDV